MTHLLIHTQAANGNQTLEVKDRGTKEEMENLLFTLAHSHWYDYIIEGCKKNLDEFTLDVDDFKELGTISIHDGKLFYDDDEITNELDSFFTDVEVVISPDSVRYVSINVNQLEEYELFQIVK